MDMHGEMKPTRAQAIAEKSPEIRIVADLDRLVSDSVGFRFKGQVHVIKPMSNKTFLGVLGQLASMDELQKSGVRDRERVIEVYAGLFATVCDSITREDVDTMEPAQISLLFKEIMACVTGRAQIEMAEKKTPLIQAQT